MNHISLTVGGEKSTVIDHFKRVQYIILKMKKENLSIFTLVEKNNIAGVVNSDLNGILDDLHLKNLYQEDIMVCNCDWVTTSPERIPLQLTHNPYEDKHDRKWMDVFVF